MARDPAVWFFTTSIDRDRDQLWRELKLATETLRITASNAENGRVSGDLERIVKTLTELLRQSTRLDTQVEMLGVFSEERKEK